MSGLKMKFGGDSAASQSTHGTDFSHLENNPNYKPEGEGNEPTGQEPTGNEPTGNEPTSNEPTGQQPTGNEPTGNEPSGSEPDNNTPEGNELKGQEPTGNEPTGQSSLSSNNDPEPTGQEPTTTVSDEILLKNLSEKLGKELTSFEDLTPQPVEIDPQVKALNEWREKTGRPIEDFFKFQKDFSKVSDLDVAREFLQIEYPTLTPDEINLELEQFIATDDDFDNDAARKNLNLKKYATKGRDVLEKLKGDLGEPPVNTLTPEIKKQLDFAKEVQEQIQVNQGQQKAYAEGISQAATSTESMQLKLSDELTIDFKVSEDDRKTIPSFIDEMPHWRTEDGNWNHKAVVEDSIKIKYFDAILKLVFEQGVNSGKDDVVKQAKNSTLGDNTSMGGQQGQGQKKPVIEGIDKLLGKHQGMSLRFGK